MTLLAKIIRAADANKPAFGTRLISLLFGLPFFAAGLFVFVGGFLNPVYQSIQAQQWQQTTATVLKSKLEWNDDSAKIEIHYTFRHRDNTYQGDRYRFDDTSTNIGVSEMKRTIAKYPPNSSIPVWFNPDNPTESVIDRDPGNLALIAIPFSLPFLTIGICGIGYALLAGVIHRRKTKLHIEAANKAASNGALEIAATLSNPDRHKKDSIRVIFTNGRGWIDFFSLFVASCFIGGIVSVFILVMIVLFMSGEGMAWLLFFFLIPFEIWAAGTVISCIGSLRNIHAPDFLITTRRGSRTIHVAWTHLGKSHELKGIRNLRIRLANTTNKFSFKTWKRKMSAKLSTDNPEPDQVAEIPKENILHGSARLRDCHKSDQGLDLEMLWNDPKQKQHTLTFTVIPTPSDD